jgi:hypothetical protein
MSNKCLDYLDSLRESSLMLCTRKNSTTSICEFPYTLQYIPGVPAIAEFSCEDKSGNIVTHKIDVMGNKIFVKINVVNFNIEGGVEK